MYAHRHLTFISGTLMHQEEAEKRRLIWLLIIETHGPLRYLSDAGVNKKHGLESSHCVCEAEGEIREGGGGGG